MEQKINLSGVDRNLIIDVARKVYPREFRLLEDCDIEKVFESFNEDSKESNTKYNQKSKRLVGDLNLPSLNDPLFLDHFANYAIGLLGWVFTYLSWRFPFNQKDQSQKSTIIESIPEDVVGLIINDENAKKVLNNKDIDELLRIQETLNPLIVNAIKKQLEQ